jgi:hypothetical protein
MGLLVEFVRACLLPDGNDYSQRQEHEDSEAKRVASMILKLRRHGRFLGEMCGVMAFRLAAV